MRVEKLTLEVIYDPVSLQIKEVLPDCNENCENCNIRELCDAVTTVLKAIVIERKWFGEVDE